MIAHTENFLRQRKLLTVLPLLALPFITLAFWALGGGQNTKAGLSSKPQEGFNATLPGARLRDGNLDKMSLYNQVLQDSQALRQARELDPYADSFAPQPGSGPDGDGFAGESGNKALPIEGIRSDDHRWQNEPDPNEAKIQARLRALEDAIDSAPGDTTLLDTGQGNHEMTADADDAGGRDIESLQKMMQNLPASGADSGEPPDSELQQLNGMLEKILDIQHPQRIQEQLRAASLKAHGQVFPVTVSDNDEAISLVSAPKPAFHPDTGLQPLSVAASPAKVFYGLEEAAQLSSRQDQAIRAVIDETETIQSGATIKMRLLEDIYVDGTLIPRDHFIYGTAMLSGARLKVGISAIRYGSSLYPVSLSVYDMDGMEGIHVPGAPTRDAAKEGASQAAQSLQLMSLDPSLTAQAAGAGMEAVKGLLSKKAKLVRVTVKAGYPILLVDQKSKGR